VRPPGALLALAWALGACAGAPVLQLHQPVVLLGEVHDNAAQHALRLRAFQALLDSGARPALALEQLDRDKQPALGAVLAGQATPEGVIAAAGGPSWNWAFYRPFIALALQHRLPIVAANVPREETRRIMKEGLAATGFDPAVPAAVLKTQAADIEASHCGMLDADTAGRMALAQVARDQFMAHVLQQHAARGVVLLAGNGHVRTDLGAPLWLSPAVRQRSVAIGVLEQGDDGGAFDQRVYTAPQPRPDPCERMRRPAPPLNPEMRR